MNRHYQQRREEQRTWLRRLADVSTPFTVAEAVVVMRGGESYPWQTSFSKCEAFIRSLRTEGLLEVISPPWSKPLFMWWAGEAIPATFDSPVQWIPEEREMNVYYAVRGDLAEGSAA